MPAFRKLALHEHEAAVQQEVEQGQPKAGTHGHADRQLVEESG